MSNSPELDRGIALFNAGDFTEAEKVFLECLANGEDAALFLEHARKALSGETARPPQDVVDVFAAVAAGDPAGLSGAARRLFRRDRVAGARVMRDIWVSKKDRAFAEARAAASRSPWAMFLRASLKWDEGKDLQALRLLRRAARGSETSWMRYYAAEILTRRLDRFEDALSEIDLTVKESPWLWEAAFLRAELRWALGEDPAKVLAPLSKANPPPSHRASMLAWRGALKMWMGRPAEALADLDSAASSGQHDASCWRGGARALLGRLESALEDLDSLLARDPDDPEALVWHGEVLRRLNRPQEARKSLERALSLSDAAVWAWTNLALLELDANRLEAARACRARLDPLTAAAEMSASSLREDLEAALVAAGGVRRSDTHLNRAWMQSAGARPPRNPAPDERLRAWFLDRSGRRSTS